MTAAGGSVGCVVVAAGSGQRLGAGRPKALVELTGRALLSWCLDGVRAAGIGQVVVVGPPEALDETRRVLALSSGAASPARRPLLVPGGQTRQQSVDAGLAALPARVDRVLVHDAARCLTPAPVFGRVLDALDRGATAVVPAVPVVDTLRARGGGVVDRSALVAVQTPQGFTRDVLHRAHALEDPEATDDALLAERLGERVVIVDGHAEALKVTTPFDLLIADAILRSRDD